MTVSADYITFKHLFNDLFFWCSCWNVAYLKELCHWVAMIPIKRSTCSLILHISAVQTVTSSKFAFFNPCVIPVASVLSFWLINLFMIILYMFAFASFRANFSRSSWSVVCTSCTAHNAIGNPCGVSWLHFLSLHAIRAAHRTVKANANQTVRLMAGSLGTLVVMLHGLSTAHQ